MFLLRVWPLLVFSSGFNLPGNAPREFKHGESIDVKVSKLTSDVLQVPHDYYFLNFCPPKDVNVHSVDENLGQILLGDSVVNTPYGINMGMDESCRVLCSRSITTVDFTRFAYMIDGEYVVNWLIDSLPASTRFSGKQNTTSDGEAWLSGFPIGYKADGNYFVYNHASFRVKYHQAQDSDRATIVGIEVEPRSVSLPQSSSISHANCNDASAMSTPFRLSRETPSILFTYDIKWERCNIPWGSRWDIYLKIKENRIHWFSILNSLVVVFLLTGLIALVLIRTLHRDITRYNSVILDEESSALDDFSDEVGWKLVHSDVFRKPRHSKLYAVFVGSGVQLLFMVFVCLFLALIGLLSPERRGSYIQALLLLFTFMGSIAGYASARIYKMFKGDEWKTTTLWAGLLFPGVAFAIFFGLNLLLWYKESSGAVPFGAMTVILVLWVGISIPLVFVGASRGYRKPAIEFPVRVHHIPRQIPRQPWYARTWVAVLVGGILPFGAVSTELFFLLGSIWHHQFYYLFGFLTIVVLILIVTCAEISVAMTYFQLSAENYHWWWRSFFASASSGVYVFLYSLIYLLTRLRITGFVPIALYLGYMSLTAFAFFLLTGSVGAIASLTFVRTIYASIKID